MNRIQENSARRGRRHEAASPASMRRRAAWALVSVGVVAATLAFWSVQPGGQGGEALAVSVPAASSPAAATVPATVQS